MKAVLFEKFNELPKLVNVDIPTPSDFGVLIKVKATGICRSDWHGWVGHDPDIDLPHVPGHEFSGVIEEVGKQVTKWRKGDAVAVPFISGCGHCSECHSGNQQVCPSQTQPGFTHWGSFAEYVTIEQADLNLVPLPENISFATAAALGCRFATSYRAVIDQGNCMPGQWVAVHGCGGVGLSAIMIAKACGANVIAVDIDDRKLDFAKQIGADYVVNGMNTDNVAAEIIEFTKGGVALSIDALGSKITCANSINNLKKRGRHVQVGLMAGKDANPAINMAKVIGDELELVGSHGMQAHRYPDMLQMIEKGLVKPELLIGSEVNLEQSIKALTSMDSFQNIGATIITQF